MSENAASTIVERDLVRSLLADRTLDQGDHPIEEALAGLGRDLHDDPIGEHPGTSGHARAIAAGLANDRGTLAGDGTLIDRGDTGDDLAVRRNDLARLDQYQIAGAKLRRGYELAILRFEAVQPARGGVLSRRPQAVGLGLAARLGQGLGEVREQDGEQQQECQCRLVDDQAYGRATDDRLDGHDRRQHGAKLDQEHDRVAHHRSRVEHGERANSRLADHLGIEDAQPPRLAPLQLEGLCVGGGSLGSTGLRRGFDTHRLASD